MKSLFAVVLALTVITAAVEAKVKTKKRGLEESLGYAQETLLPLGGLIELGSIHGIELQSLEALGHGLTNGILGYGVTSLGNHGLNLLSGGVHDYSLALGNIGHYSVESAALLGNRGLYGSGLTLSSGYASGYSLPSAPVSIPQTITPAPVISQPPLRRPLTREESAAASPSRLYGATRPGISPAALPPIAPSALAVPAAPTPPLIPPTAYPPTNVPIPVAVRPPAPLRVPGPPPAPVPVQLPSPTQPQPPTPLPAPAPLPVPLSAPQPAQTPAGGRLGSGSLGYTDLGNGVVALGSGSLGYTHSQAVNLQRLQQQAQLVQQNAQNSQVNQGLTYGSAQDLPLDQVYGGLQGSIQYPQQQNLVYANVQNSQNAGLQQGTYGTQQLSFSGQGGGLNVGYGGYSLSGNRAYTLEQINSGLSGLNLNYGGGY